MKRPKDLGRDPFHGVPVGDRPDMKVSGTDWFGDTVYYDKVEDSYFYLGGSQVGRVDM